MCWVLTLLDTDSKLCRRSRLGEKKQELRFGHLKYEKTTCYIPSRWGYISLRKKVWTEVKIQDPSVYRRYLKPGNWIQLVAFPTDPNKSWEKEEGSRGKETFSERRDRPTQDCCLISFSSSLISFSDHSGHIVTDKLFYGREKTSQQEVHRLVTSSIMTSQAIHLNQHSDSELERTETW